MIGMKRILTLGITRSPLALRPVRCFAAPAQKYVDVYEGAKSVTYPVELLGGSHIEFAKMLYAFAEVAEGKKYNLYAKEFTKLDAIIEKAGPFWAEENILESSAFSSLNPGFTFVLAWMQNEGMIDMLPYVKSSYKELANEASKVATATITIAKDAASSSAEIAAAKKEIAAVHASGPQASYTLEYEFKVDPAIVGGYCFEVGSQCVNNSAAQQAAAAATSAGSAGVIDWTAVPAAPPRAAATADEMLIRLLGAKVDDLMDADKVELKYGA